MTPADYKAIREALEYAANVSPHLTTFDVAEVQMAIWEKAKVHAALAALEKYRPEE